jgi:excisionase family DNA binding protein
VSAENPQIDSQLLTAPDVAKRLGCSERHVWRLINDEEIEVFRHRGLTRITEKALAKFIARNTTKKKDEDEDV